MTVKHPIQFDEALGRLLGTKPDHKVRAKSGLAKKAAPKKKAEQKP